eukprot:6214866-Amphidinium_carterae.1
MPRLALVMFKGYLGLLGWLFTARSPPSEVFDTLGVRFDLTEMVCSGRFSVRNLPSRLLPARAARLRGCLGFAGSQLFGRLGKVGLR